MRNVLILLYLSFFVVSAVAENLIINPGFDEAPWDSGWTVTGDSGDGYISAIPDTDRYYSHPQSCKLIASTWWNEEAYIYLYQEIHPVKSCTCRVIFQNVGYGYDIFYTSFAIYIKINGEYVREWFTPGNNPVWTKWEKIYDSTNIVDGIKFYALAYIYIHGDVETANFWIDDVYISGTEVGIEEEDISNNNDFLEIYPNPFRDNTVISYSLFVNGNDASRLTPYALRIFDVSGRLVRTIPLPSSPFTPLKVVWDGRDTQGNEVLSGVYFIRLEITRGTISYPTKKLIKF